MNAYLNHTDKYLVGVYFIFVTIVGAYLEKFGNGHDLESAIHVLSHVALGFGLFYVIVTWLFPRYLSTGKYIKLLIFLVVVFLLFGFMELGLIEMIGKAFEKPQNIFQNSAYKLVAHSMMSSFLNVGMLLVLYTGKKYFETQMGLKSAEKKRRDIEFKVLRDQMDPHFLFNNLNSVETLIEQDPHKAILYVQKLSSLYRYFLSTNTEEVVSLEEEIEFANNYIYLIEQRFGDLYQFKIESNDNGERPLVLPGALQTAIENVIKHNKASSKEPIETIIEIQEAAVLISNNINLKNNNEVEESKIGLKNLQSRYNLLGNYKIKTYNKNGIYTLSIPLIKEIVE